MFDYVGEGHSFFAINHKDSFEKILQFVLLLFKLVFLAEGCQQTERWVGASALNLSFHVMTFERVFCKEHEIKEHSERPDID